MDELTKSNILYFPHIEIADSASLKAALCVWDAVYRIVPENFKPNDSDEVLQAVDAGALRNIRLSSADLAETREAYSEFIESISFMPDALDREPREMAEIHSDKMDERMVEELSELIGEIARNGDWLQLPRGLADGYMLFLANSVSRKRRLPKFTDSDTMFVSMEYFAMNGEFSEFVYRQGAPSAMQMADWR